jgi:hypothetical protein
MTFTSMHEQLHVNLMLMLMTLLTWCYVTKYNVVCFVNLISECLFVQLTKYAAVLHFMTVFHVTLQNIQQLEKIIKIQLFHYI